MKKLLILSLLAGFSAQAARPVTELNCIAKGEIDGIRELAVVPTDLTGQINASLLIKNGKDVIRTSYNSNGSIEDKKILLLEQDTGPFGVNSYYLEKSAKGYSVTKYNLCNFYYQEETCPADASPVLTSAESGITCKVK
jgi:hypothetical protein